MHDLPAPLADLVRSLELSTEFSDEVMREVEALVEAPGIDDPSLVDHTSLPFVTIDAVTSRDLDQAVYVAREGEGYLVAYAIADASHYVRPGSALFAEAMRRGATYYLPGASVPMLPRALSEGIVSLNPDGPRRALVFFHHLDARTEILSTELVRGRIRSRAKLSFSGVQALVDGTDTTLASTPFRDSLFLLREVGQKRMQLATERGLVRYRREEIEVKLADGGASFSVVEQVRDEVELWNEQISLLCNAEGGRLLREHPAPAVQPIYRVHGGPDPERLHALAALTRELARVHALPEAPWIWAEETQSLAAYLAALPVGAHGAHDDRIARAITRQAIMVNLRSAYSTEPGPHVGVGAEPYARFSAPMREMVGVFLHKEAVEMLTGEHPEVEVDEALRAEVVEIANRAKDVQRRVADLANELVIDRVFRPELERSTEERTRFVGTVMGITSGKVHVRLDAPPIDVKLYLRDLGRDLAPTGPRGERRPAIWLEPDEHGVVLRERDGHRPVLTLGAEIRVVVVRRDDAQRRWVLGLVP
ncbi:MAG: RNB domain-containing ribonuclease [Deltaproteobacteria bacterium]|nr:RNB domain-containing ribonuclease [Deltaproteobacteria bacterium]